MDEAAGAHVRRVLHEQRRLDKLKSHGLRPRQTLLLTGPPGCGKTLTASAIAGELGLPLFIVRLESLMTRYLGETASKLRLIFEAVEKTRAVYLFDEFDSIGIARGSENDVGEMRRVLNSFLVFVENHRGNSVIIAATNHGHLLDRALYRRFDDLIELGMPSAELAERTLRERLAGQKAPRLAYAKLASAAEGLSYAEITRVCEEAIKDMLLHDKKSLPTNEVLRIVSERRLLQRGCAENCKRCSSELSGCTFSQELAAYEEDAGVSLEIRGVSGYQMKLEPLDVPSRGIVLESSRVETVMLADGGTAPVVVATVFVKHGKLTHLTKSIEEYAQSKTRTDKKTGKIIKCDHEEFIANIESIGIAAIEAFWTSRHPLPDLDVATWWEVWVRVASEAERARHEEAVLAEADRLEMQRRPGKLSLPEHTVFLIKTTRRTLASATALLNFVSERHPALTGAFFIEQTPREQQQWATDLKGRIVLPPEAAPAVCILDTGVNRGHPLLSDILAESDHDTVRAEWGTDDHFTNGHGTQMAGLAAYGDLTPLLESRDALPLSHRLESVKILPRFGNTEAKTSPISSAGSATGFQTLDTLWHPPAAARHSSVMTRSSHLKSPGASRHPPVR